MAEYDNIKVKDQLGRPEDKNITVKRKQDQMIMESNTLKVYKSTIGHSWIVGSAQNGIVGVNTGTYDGQQQVVGGHNRVETLLAVVSPNKVFREHFRDTTYKDWATAHWDTTNHRLAMSSSSNHATVYNTTAVTESIAFNDGVISTLTLSASETKFGNDQIKYYISADDTGDTWEEVTLNTPYSVVVTGSDLKVKTVFIGNGGSDTYIEDLRVEYGG